MVDQVNRPNHYTADDIQVLEGLEAVRRRPGMYIGGTDIKALHHMVYEVVDNSIDEAMAGYCDRIAVTIHKDGSVTVQDRGRGIPVGIQKQTGKSALEVVMTMLHAGGKFGGGGYKVSGGLHGVGVSAVNALSEWLEVEVRTDGKVYFQRYHRGVPQADVEVIGEVDDGDARHPHDLHARQDHLRGDRFKFDTLVQRFREMAFLTRGLTIDFIGRADRQRRARCPSTSKAACAASCATSTRTARCCTSRSTSRSEVEGDQVEAAIQYNDGYTESVFAFANTINTPDGGTHLTGLRSALTRTINDWATRAGPAQGQRRELHRRRHARGPDRHRQRQAARPAVRVADQGQAAQHRGAQPGRVGGGRSADASGWRRTRATAKKIVEKCMHLQPGARGRPQGARPGHPQERAGEPDPARQAGRLLRARPAKCELYIVEGDSRRWLGQAGPRPALPGDPAAARQDPERREGPAGQDRWPTTRSRR